MKIKFKIIRKICYNVKNVNSVLGLSSLTKGIETIIWRKFSMLEINQLTPEKILANKDTLDVFLKEKFNKLITPDSLVTKWNPLVQRFQLNKFKEFPNNEIMSSFL